MRCFSVSVLRAATRRLSTTPRSRSPAACGVAPKLGLFNNSRTSPFGESGLHVPLPIPGEHAGLGSTASRFPHEASRSTVPRSRAALLAIHRHYGRKTFRRTPPCYDVGRKTHRVPLGRRCRGGRVTQTP